jgi:dihydrofolate reductase
MQIKLIAAMAKNRVIGNNTTIPRHYSEDFKYFKNLTTGHIIVMGGTTYHSIGKPLPNRRNIVLTSHPIEGIECYDSIPALLQKLEKEGVEDFFVI